MGGLTLRSHLDGQLRRSTKLIRSLGITRRGSLFAGLSAVRCIERSIALFA